jgi:hypothetical protein
VPPTTEGEASAASLTTSLLLHYQNPVLVVGSYHPPSFVIFGQKPVGSIERPSKLIGQLYHKRPFVAAASSSAFRRQDSRQSDDHPSASFAPIASLETRRAP